MRKDETGEEKRSDRTGVQADLAALAKELAQKDAELEREIGARLELEEMLREAGRSGDRLVENLSDVIYSADAEGILTYLSPAVERFLGYLPAECIGRHISEFLHEEDLVELGQRFPRVLGGQTMSSEYRALTKSGEMRWMRTSSQPVIEEGRVVGVQGVLSDITEHKLAEEQIRRQNDFLVSVLESLTHPFYVLDAHDFTVRIANSAARSDGTLARSTCYALTHHRDTPCDTVEHPCPVGQIKRTKAPVTVEHTHFDARGHARQVEVHGYPVFDDAGDVVQVIEYAFDITERKLAEEALQKLTHELGERIKELDCLYGISRLAGTQDISLEEILQGTVDLIPPAWQFPEATYARIILDGQEFRTDRYEETPWQQTADILVHGERRGRVEVGFLAAKPESDEGPFLKEERDLIEAIAGRLGEITERVRVEEALRESEALWRSVTENSPDHVILLDTDLRIEFVNYASPGLAARELIGMPLYSLAAREQQAHVRQILENALARGNRVTYETTYQVPEGDTYYYESRVVPRLVDGRIVGLAVNARDITRHKQDAAALRQSEERSRQLLETLQEGIWVVDEEANTTFVNPRMAEMLGHTVEEMQGQHLYSFMDERGAEITRRNLERRAQGIHEQHDFEFLRKDGSRIYALLETSPIYDDDGEYRGAIAGVQDITERRRVEEALQKSETLLNEAQQMARLGGWELNVRTSQVTWTDEVYRIHEVPPGFTPTLDNALAFYHPQDRPALEAAIQQALEGAVPWDLELRFITATGRRLWVRATGKAEDQDGEVVRLTGTFQDITERKEAEKALEEAAAAAERNRLARDLHDSVTQALFSASLVAEVLPQTWKRDPDAALEGLEELRLLTRGALAEMRTMLLELRPATLQKTDLDELLLQLTEATASRMPLEAVFSIEPSPVLPPEVHVTFYRVAQEALNNVVKHAGAKQVTVSLQASPPASSQQADGWQGVLTLQISDDGCGLASEGAEADQLGLSIMRERADGIHARLEIESQREQGTRVTLVWPRK